MDHSFREHPSPVLALHANILPPQGGDTCFAGMQCAYDAPNESMKAQLDGLQATHESAHVFAPSEEIRMQEAEERDDGAYAERAATYPSAVHPVVLEHPETGRKGLYVNPEFTTQILGMAKAESDALLKDLFDHVLQP